MNINQLPPEVLTIILKDKRISLSKRIALRAVSSHWQDTIEKNVLKPITKLALNGKSVGNVPCLPLKAELIPLYARLFPALADLTVFNDIKVHMALPPLLTAFSTTLTTLQLRQSCRYKLNDDVQWTINLASAINSLTTLTNLDLDMSPTTTLLLRLVPILPRLQKFYYRVLTSVPVEVWQNITLSPLIRMTDLKVERVTTANYTATVADTVATFPSLQSLTLSLFTYGENRFTRFTDLLRSLSALEHLSELSLGILHYSWNQLPLPTDQPLIRVKKLTLSFSNSIDDSELFTSVLVAWFPSLEAFTLKCANYFSLTTTTLRNLTRLEQLSELSFDFACILKVELGHPTDRQLASLKTLHLAIDHRYPAERLFSSVLAAWFPRLKELTLELDKNFQQATAILRDLNYLEHLFEFHLFGLQFKQDRLCLPSSSDRRLLNVKWLRLGICFDPADSPDGKFLCTALAAWFPGLEQLTIDSHVNGQEAFQPSMLMLSGLATLEHLTELSLDHNVNYAKDRFTMPASTDQVLSRVKNLYVEFDGSGGCGGCDFDVEEHICSVLAAWFPGLEELSIDIYHDYEFDWYKFYLTSSMLRDLANLQYLRKLYLPKMLYSKKHLDTPSPTDRPLTCLKKLTLEIVDMLEEFDESYFCSTLAVWIPHLKELTISPQNFNFFYSESIYKKTIAANLHHFGKSIKLN